MASLSSAFGSSLFFLLFLATGCAGGIGGGSTAGPVDPSIGPTAFSFEAGLASVAPGPGVLRIDFTPPSSTDFEVAAFVSSSRGNLFATAPIVPAGGETSLFVTGLPDNDEHFIGLGMRPVGSGAYSQVGPVLTATPGSPVYVDASASPGGDGTSPATAYNDLFTATLNVFAQLLTVPGSSVNVWIRDGSYPINATLPVTAGVNFYGGFGADFDLATRDIEGLPTILRPGSGQSAMQIADVAGNSLSVIVDGLRILGDGAGNVGIDANASNPCSLELRSTLVDGMADRGVRMRNILDLNFDVVVTHSESSHNGADGLNGSGSFDYTIYNSIFASNVQEGVDLNDLEPETGGIATLDARHCQFFGNGNEGLDCTLGAPLFPTFGAFSVQILGCSFERNTRAGLLIDCDFELSPGYSADIFVRESSSRGNAGSGFHLDLDGPLDTTAHESAFLYRVLSTSNGEHGVYVTSESRGGIMVLAGSAMVGNTGVGLRMEGQPGADGNRTVAATGCLFASNNGGGVSSRDIPASVCSSIAYLQPTPFDANTVAVDNVATDDPSAVAFLNAPEEYGHVIAWAGPSLTLISAPGFSTGAMLELANDGAERSASTIAGTVVTLTEAPEDFGVPGLLAAFAPGAPSVNEDYRLGLGSVALGAGLGGADAGPYGLPTSGTPGVPEPLPVPIFHVLETTPAGAVPVGTNESLLIDFSRVLNGASANASTVRVLRNGTPLSIALQTAGARLTISPPGGGWGSGNFQVELDGLAAADGTPQSGSVVLPFRR